MHDFWHFPVHENNVLRRSVVEVQHGSWPGVFGSIQSDLEPTCDGWVAAYCWWFRNPAPVDMLNIPLFTGFHTRQVVCLGISKPSTVALSCLQYNLRQLLVWTLECVRHKLTKTAPKLEDHTPIARPLQPNRPQDRHRRLVGVGSPWWFLIRLELWGPIAKKPFRSHERKVENVYDFPYLWKHIWLSEGSI